jgi:hypothetical protein
MTHDLELQALIAKIGNSGVVCDAPVPPEQRSTTCRRCGNPVEGDPKVVTERFSGATAAFHPACWDTHCTERSEKEAEERERWRARELKQRIDELEKRFAYHMSGNVSGGEGYGICHPPSWPYARFDNAEFRARSSKKIVGAVEKWDPKKLPTLLLCAPTGKGKTAALLAWLWRYRDQQIERLRAGEEKVWITSFVFATGPEFAVARRNAALGDEAPLVRHALDCGILIMDELGFEKPSEVPFEIVDHRYRKQGVTVVTTGLRPKEFRTKYGDAMYRRLSESGAVLEDFPSE